MGGGGGTGWRGKDGEQVESLRLCWWWAAEVMPVVG